MKKYLVVSLLIIFTVSTLIFLLGLKRKAMPSMPPNISITYNGNKIETALGEYNWFDKKQGGNTYFADTPENIAKDLKNISVKNGDSIYYTFGESWKQPNKVKISLVQPNKSNKLEFGLMEQKVIGNLFIIPNESGEQIFLVTAYWDETHSVDYVFKLIIQ